MSDKNTNGLDEATMMHFVRESNSIDAQIAALQMKRKNFRSGIKSFGVKLRSFDRTLNVFNAADGGAEALEELREERKLARLIGLPIGHQLTFFDDTGAAPDEPEGGAYDQGRRAYVSLVKESEIPFAENLQQGQDWLRGYREAEAACKVGKERAAVGPGEPEAAKGTLPDKSKGAKPAADAKGKTKPKAKAKAKAK